MIQFTENILPGFTIPQRYVMAILAFFGVMNCYALRSCFSIAINQIVHIKDHNLANYTQCVGDVQEDKMRSVSYEWTHRQKTWSLCSFYFGYFLTQFPGGFLAEYFGGKQVFGLSVLLAGSMSMIDPSVIKYLEWKGLVTTRLLMGAAQVSWVRNKFDCFIKRIVSGRNFPSLILSVVQLDPSEREISSGDPNFCWDPTGSFFRQRSFRVAH